MDMNVSKLWEILKDRKAYRAAVHGVARVGHNLVIKKQQHDCQVLQVNFYTKQK